MSINCPKCETENPSDSKYCKECATPLPPSEEIPVPTETLETPKEELTTGSTFAGRYQIIEELGKGGMGKVYRVLDKELKEEVALKLIKLEIASDKKTVERFNNELKLARKIIHKNVGRMYELMEDKGTRFITMEYVPGEDLKSFIRRARQLTPGTVVFIAKQVCEGLEEAHRLGVVHRDLKPSNIMIDKEGNARIMDFGIARSLKAKGITGAGVMIGTPEYMSPEQVESKDVDQRSDIYSLGVILYEMASGRVPFEGDTPFAIGMKHKSEAPKDPRELNAQIPEDLSHVILKCLEKDKEHRYQSTGELRSELDNIERGIPATDRVVPKRKPITSKEITVTFRLRKLLIPALALLVIATITLVLFIQRGPNLDPSWVAVAVFENQTGDPKLDPVGRMAADWITQGLSQTGLVSVAPLLPDEFFEGLAKGKDRIRLVAEESGAGNVVSGTYYLQGQNIRFHAQVSDVQAGKVLSALDPVSGPVADPIKPIELLRQRVMGALVTVLDSRIGLYVDTRSPIPTYEAYQEFLEGGRSFTNREWEKAIEHFTRAFSLDPKFTFPMLWASVAHLNLGEYAEADALGRRIAKFREGLSQTERYWLEWLEAYLRGDNVDALRATRQLALLAPGTNWNYAHALDAVDCNRPQEAVDTLKKLDPERGWMKGWFYYWGALTDAHHMLGDHKKELKEARRGRKQYPEVLSTLSYEVRALVALGKIDDVYRRLDESLNLPPQRGWSPGTVMRNAAEELRAHGYREDSLKVAERAIAYYKARSEGDFRYSLARSLYLAEQWEEAGKLFNVLAKEKPENINYQGYLGTIAARLGNREEAMRLSAELRKMERPYIFGNHIYWQACVAALLGEEELAVKLLREAFAKGASYERLHPDMDLEPLGDYPPFIELLKPKD